MRCRPFLRAALFVALACSFGLAVFATEARADVDCAVQVRHLPAPGSEVPGTFSISLIADSPQSVAAEWEAYTDRGFLQATLPVVQLAAASAGPSPVMLAARSRTIVIRLPAGTHVYESWLRGVGTSACAPPAGDPVHGSRSSHAIRDTIPTPDPADAPVDAIVAPNLERMDCPRPFADPHPVAEATPQYPLGVRSTGVALVKVRIGPDGRVIDASVFRSAGNIDLDRAAVEAAGRSTFTSPVAFCRPTFGNYIVHEAFQ